MTVMERPTTKSSASSKTVVNNNNNLNNTNNTTNQQSSMSGTSGQALGSVDERRSSLSSTSHYNKEVPRKGSIGYTVTPVGSSPQTASASAAGSPATATASTNLPNTSNLSLSSTTSTNSSNSKPSSSKYTIFNAAAASTQSGSRRQSGNSITIKVTSSENNTADYDTTTHGYQRRKLNEFDEISRDGRIATTTVEDEDFHNNYDQEDHDGDNDDDDEDDYDLEETKSNSNEQQQQQRSLSQKKKSKEKKKFVRSSAQQQHHLVYQESEDLPDEHPHPPSRHHHRLPQIPHHLETNMNSAFDELFAAAEQGNSTKSAIIEAKMAAEAAALAPEPSSPTSKHAADESTNGGGSSSRRNSRPSSFRATRPRAFSRLLPHRDPNLDPGVMYGNEDDHNDNQNASNNNNNNNNNDFYDRATRHLGSPQQLTRSCSCKRPGSFKKMRSKNASPNRQQPNATSDGRGGVNTRGGAAVAPSPTGGDRDSKKSNSPTSTTAAGAAGAGGQRRGTQCSITLLDDFDSRTQQNRAGSLPFENLIRPQTLAIPNEQQAQSNGAPAEAAVGGAEVYRVRQFVTSNGSVINRGDSFKRSFKRSNQSLSSSNGTKRERDTPNGNNNGNITNGSQQQAATTTTGGNSNQLNLPDQTFGGGSGGSGSSINETTTTTSSNNNNLESSTTSGSLPMRPMMNGGVAANMVTSDSSSGLVATPGRQQQQQPPRVDTPLFKTYVVYVLGAPTVGKNALIKQFKTSEYRGTYDICAHQSTDDEQDEGVSILLDGIESKLQFTAMDVEMIKPSSVLEITKDNDAFIVVYSISDKASFSTALEMLKCIRSSENKTRPVILVGNKSDLVRKRSISREDGAALALKYGCKFVETSVAINDKVDDLLAGILKQIRLNESFERELEAVALANNEQETSFMDYNNYNNKKHIRNYSDAHLHDLVRDSNNNNNNNQKKMSGASQGGPKPISERGPGGFLSFKSNTLSRKFFKNSKNHRDFSQSVVVTTPGAYTTDSIDTRGGSGGVVRNRSAPTTISFFHKIYNSIFKKKSNSSHLQSVENLFSLPYSITNRSKKT